MSELETPRLTEERLAEIKARLTHITAGPWEKEPNWARVWRRVPEEGVFDCLFADSRSGPVEGPTKANADDYEFIASARTDVPALCQEVEQLQSDLQIALGALADIANLTEDEIADGTAQRKAQRIYNQLRGRTLDEPVD